MVTKQGVGLIAMALMALFGDGAAARAQLACGHFTQEPMPVAAPRRAESAVARFEEIKRAVLTEPYRILFLGDSITQRYDPEIWQRDMAARGVLNAGVNGDRTENLLWRLEHGNLADPRLAGLIVMIGTNDLTSGGHPRRPALVAEGIRANLQYLRQQVPNARILLLGLYPRGDAPQAAPKINEVNNLIRNCGDGRAVVYADIGGVLIEPDGQLTRAVAPDLLHFSRLGYERLAVKLNPLIDDLLAGR